MAKAAEFAKRMERLGAQIATGASRRTNKLALTIQLNLLQSTPVDTAMAISNWILSLDHPSTDAIEPYVPGEGGSTRQMNIGAAYNLAAYNLVKRKNGQSIWISNSLPYIGNLNDGSSWQAPAGFFQTAIMNGVQATKGIKVLPK